MKKIILFGATGHLGKEILKEAIQRENYEVTAVIRNQSRIKEISHLTNKYIIADVTKPSDLMLICSNFDVVISALGKSVSPNEHSKHSFDAIDFTANSLILAEAQKSGIKKFVYVSAFHAEKYVHLAYFRTHHQFAEKVKQSGIDYSIIKPPAIFSGFLDMIEMAKKGQLVTIGEGNKKTNPIYEGDLAKICVDAIEHINQTIEAGGKEVYTRKQLNEIIQKEVNPRKKVKNVPLGFFKLGLPFLKIFNRNMYDKFAFFCEVIQHDTIALQVGQMKFEEYIQLKNK